MSQFKNKFNRGAAEIEIDWHRSNEKAINFIRLLLCERHRAAHSDSMAETRRG